MRSDQVVERFIVQGNRRDLLHADASPIPTAIVALDQLVLNERVEQP
jgi:hypothetical protein